MKIKRAVFPLFADFNFIIHENILVSCTFDLTDARAQTMIILMSTASVFSFSFDFDDAEVSQLSKAEKPTQI